MSYFEFLAACTDNAQVVSKGYGKDDQVPSKGDWDTREGEDYIGGGSGGGATWKPKPADGNF